MANLSSILRIIEGTQNNDVDKVIRYAKRLITDEEDDVIEELIKEKFNPNAAQAVMDDISYPLHISNCKRNCKFCEAKCLYRKEKYCGEN